MKRIITIPATLVILLFFSPKTIAQDLEVAGKAKIGTMDKVNTADSVVVRLADSTLAIRDVSTLTEMQILSISNDTIFLSDGGFVELPADQVDDADADPTNELQSWTNLPGIPMGFADDIDDVDDADADPSNEIQSLSQVLAQDSSAADIRIKNLKDPSDAQDAATKAYVDMLEATIRDIIGVKDIDNNRYETVTIGSQVWMAENLRVAHYNDGTPIPLVTGNTAWQDSSNAGNPAYTWYDNGDYGTPDYGAPEYGALYNWYAIDTLSNGNKNVCPIGWHVPSDVEWTVLTDFLGGPNDAGGKMKETGLGHWNPPNTNATNESGFSGLPGGFRFTFGSIFNVGYTGDWWSSSEFSTVNAWVRRLDFSSDGVSRYSDDKGIGISVRCLRD